MPCKSLSFLLLNKKSTTIIRLSVTDLPKKASVRMLKDCQIVILVLLSIIFYGTVIHEESIRLLLRQKEATGEMILIGVAVRFVETNRTLEFYLTTDPTLPKASRSILPDLKRKPIVWTPTTDAEMTPPKRSLDLFMTCFTVCGHWENLVVSQHLKWNEKEKSEKKCVELCGNDSRLYSLVEPIHQRFILLEYL